MIIAKEVKLKYDYLQPYIRKLGELVNQTLFHYCQENHFAYTSKHKTLESVSEKIETGRFESWDSLDDLFAATIIIPNLAMEEEVINYLSSVFEKVILKKKGSDKKDPEVFRFNSTRFIARYKPLKGLEENIVSKMKFEVQIRSAFEHAWSVATHSLAYKTDEVDWRILRLSAQLKSSVEQLDMLISGYSDIYKHITRHEWPMITRKTQLSGFIKEKIETGKIPKEVVPNDLSRFCDNIINLIISCRKRYKLVNSDLLSEILDKIDAELDSYNESTFPRSISLFQLILGVIIRHTNFFPDTDRYTAFVTPELIMLYPEVKKIKKCFQFE